MVRQDEEVRELREARGRRVGRGPREENEHWGRPDGREEGDRAGGEERDLGDGVMDRGDIRRDWPAALLAGMDRQGAIQQPCDHEGPCPP